MLAPIAATLNPRPRSLRGIRWLLLLAFTIVQTACQSAGEAAADTRPSSTFDQVIQSKTLRAGFVSYPPGLSKETSTGQVSGIYPEILGRIAENLDLKLDYTEEVGWGTMIEGLETHRYDVVGSPVWANPVRGKRATFSNPVYYSAVGIWVRENDSRFTEQNARTAINDPAVRIGAMDGSTPEVIAREDFPRATVVSYPEMTGESQIFLDLTAGKIDVFFAELAVAHDFTKNNPGKIRNVAVNNPIRVFANVILVPQGDMRLKQAIDVALADLQTSGYVDRVLRKYEPYPNFFLRVAPPYRAPSPEPR